MIIGIDASRAFLKRRTGIEEYAYQTICHLRDALPETDSVVLYVRKKLIIRNGWLIMETPEIDFPLPKHWRIRALWAPRFWTQIGLSLEMLFHGPDMLFVPAHTVPFLHPQKTIVTIHGLEYEFCPEAYSFWERLYMRFFIRYSCHAASTIVCVSENTKRDVMKLYRVSERKMIVIHEGYNSNFQFPISNSQSNIKSEFPISRPYLLFVGRLEERKNIVRIIEAFDILKERYGISHRLVLAGKWGHGKERIKSAIHQSLFRDQIMLLGYVDEMKKWELLRAADVFLFPTLYEGFGIPILEAQSVGVPVVTSNTSSLPEVGGEGAFYVDPISSESIASGIQLVLSERVLRDGIIEKAAHNVNRFSWQTCADGLALLFRKMEQSFRSE